MLGFGSQIEKISSSYFLIFYAFFCSFPFILVFFLLNTGVFSFIFDCFLSGEVLLVFFLIFIIKFPVFFLHLWLPKAHVEAPTTTSMLLARLLLKFGTIGFYRFLIFLKTRFLSFFVFISLVSILIRCCLCLTQSDLKSYAAYSSINHMGFLLLVLVFQTVFSNWSCVVVIFIHGLISLLMFFYIGIFYHTNITRIVYYYGNFLSIRTFLSIMVFVVWLFNSRIPPRMSFFSEFIGLGLIFFYNFYFFFIIFLFFIDFLLLFIFHCS